MSDQYFRFLTRDAARGRSALLEQLLARAEAWVSVADWRADAFRVIAPQAASMPAVAAAALCADHGPVDAAWVCAATPVHYVAEMSNVRLPVDGMLALTSAGADSLAADFNRVWQGSGIRMTATDRRGFSVRSIARCRSERAIRNRRSECTSKNFCRPARTRLA